MPTRSIYGTPPAFRRNHLSSRIFFGRGTRFYAPSTGAAAVSPSFLAGWEDTSIGSRLAWVTTKISSAMTTVSFADVNTEDKDILFRQYVSAPLAAQTIGGQFIQVAMRASETLSTNDMFLTWGLRLVSNDGTIDRGTLVALHRDNTEIDTTLTNRNDMVFIDTIAVVSGDRLVFEIGTGGLPATVHSSSVRIGDADAGDLPEDDSTTADNNSWLEFQQPLSFLIAVAGLVGRKLLLGVGQ